MQNLHHVTASHEGCLDIYQPSGDHHHIITSSSDSSLTITYGAGDTLL